MESHSAIRLGLCLVFIIVSLNFVTSFPEKSRTTPHRPEQQTPSCTPESRYHKETKKCYPLRMGRGPCGMDMIFVEDKKNQSHGICQCTDRIGCDYWPFTFWAPEKRCYPLFQRGPCKENEWLIHHHHRSECKNRLCPEDVKNPSKRTFTHGSNCYQVGTKGFCKSPQDKLFFAQGNPQVQCSPRPDRVLDSGCSNISPQSDPMPVVHGNGSKNLGQQPQMITVKHKPVSSTPESTVIDTVMVGDHRVLLTKQNLKCAPGSITDSVGDCQEEVKFQF